MSDLAAMLSDPDFRTGDYLVTRRGQPTYLDGILQPAEPATFQTGDASLQPANGATLKVLPEASHAECAMVLYTSADLRCEPVPDVVTIEDAPFAGDWAVVAVAPWFGFGESFRVVGLARQVAR